MSWGIATLWIIGVSLIVACCISSILVTCCKVSSSTPQIGASADFCSQIPRLILKRGNASASLMGVVVTMIHLCTAYIQYKNKNKEGGRAEKYKRYKMP